MRLILSVLFAIAALLGSASLAQQRPPRSSQPGLPRVLDSPPAKIRFDPFEKPPIEELTPPRAGYRDEPVERQWSPELRATLVAGESPLANLGGVVLGIGEETHGYRLLEVGPFEAVFERAGERLVLELKKAAESRGDR